MVAVLCTAALSAPLAPSALGDALPDEQYTVQLPDSNPSDVAYWGMYATGAPVAVPMSGLIAQYATGNTAGTSLLTDVRACTAADDGNCAGAQAMLYQAQLPQCTATRAVDCISNISATDDQGRALSIHVTGALQSGARDYAGDPSIGLPDGHEGTLFTIDGITHPGGDAFLAWANVAGSRSAGNSKFGLDALDLHIEAVRVETGTFGEARQAIGAVANAGFTLGHRLGEASGGDASGCSLHTGSTCAKVYPLPLNIRFGLSLTLSSPVTGWLHGRLRDASASITMDPQGYQTVAIAANPVVVPSVLAWTLKSAAPDTITTFYADPAHTEGGRHFGCALPDIGASAPCPAHSDRSLLRSPEHDAASLAEFAMWLPLSGDRAVAAPTLWTASLTSSGSSACYASGNALAGIVATNATMYLAGPPVFDTATQTLDYKVAAAHFLQDGHTVFRGTYDLLLRSDVARCLYAFSAAPVGATVSVVSAEGGEQTAAVTAVSERDGWLHLVAAGFTFSTPTVRIRLTQAAPQADPSPTSSSTATASPAASPSPSTTATSKAAQPAAPAKKITITCVKGKQTKKVAAVSPKCPSGWKRLR